MCVCVCVARCCLQNCPDSHCTLTVFLQPHCSPRSFSLLYLQALHRVPWWRQSLPVPVVSAAVSLTAGSPAVSLRLSLLLRGLWAPCPAILDPAADIPLEEDPGSAPPGSRRVFMPLSQSRAGAGSPWCGPWSRSCTAASRVSLGRAGSGGGPRTTRSGIWVIEPKSRSVEPESGSVGPESGSVGPESGSAGPEPGLVVTGHVPALLHPGSV